MREDFYNKDYREREYDRFSDFDPQKPKKKTSFLTVLLVGLLVLLVCSLGYDNIVKPYLEKRAQQTESPVTSFTQENEEFSIYEVDDITSNEDDNHALDFIEEPIQRSQPVTVEQAEYTHPIQPEQGRRNTATNHYHNEDESALSTLEILERKNHADVVKRAQRAGVSTEGSTLDILERINHADVVKRARRAGVSTEGSTLDILERINHADVVKRAKRAGVSTEGSTLDILERINHADVVKRAKKAGVSTEGTTLEILERINRKNLQRMGY